MLSRGVEKDDIGGRVMADAGRPWVGAAVVVAAGG